MHEESVRGTAKEVLGHFQATEPKGEFVIIVAGCGEGQQTQNADLMDDDRKDKAIKESKYQRKMREREEKER